MFFKKLVTAVLVWHVLFTGFFPFTVFAQEGESTPTPTPAAESTESPSPTPIPTEQPTASPPPSSTPTPIETPLTEILASPTPEASGSALLAAPESTESAALALSAADLTPPEPSSTTTQQISTTQSSTTSDSNSGGNSQQVSSEAVMTTGNTTAVANSVTVANLSEINSSFITVIETILTADEEDINLYRALMDVITGHPNTIPQNSDIFIDQNAVVNSETSASANSGYNSQSAGQSKMTTGNAAALADSITAANINLIGSNVILAIINILVDYDGDIILPNDEQISLTEGELGPNVNVAVNQNAVNSSETASRSVSGENTQTASDSADLTSGNSISILNSQTLSNIVQIGGGMGFLFLNNLGGWTGQLINWNSPGENLTLDQGEYKLTRTTPGGNFLGNTQTNITANQTANVTSATYAQTNTGGNSQSADIAQMTTGNSTAISNNLTLSNLTSIGANFLLGIINIVGNWSGNIITPYPNLKLSLTDNKDSARPGDTNEYVLTVENMGDAPARNVDLTFLWPDQMIPLSSEASAWSIGDLVQGESRTFRFKGRVAENAGGETVLLARALTTTSSTQEETAGNASHDQTRVEIPGNAPPDTRTPDLSVSVWNNTGEYVLPGDTILVKITLTNNSPFIARNVNLKSQITNEHPIEFPELDYALGDVRANGKVTISFSLTLNKDTLPALYHITSQATGQADSGDTGYSNSSVSNFLVKGQGSLPQIASQVSAETNYPGPNSQVLGLSSGETADGVRQKDIMRFLPLFALASAALYITKRKYTHYLKTHS